MAGSNIRNSKKGNKLNDLMVFYGVDEDWNRKIEKEWYFCFALSIQESVRFIWWIYLLTESEGW